MKKILVTGNNGLLGTAVVRALKESQRFDAVLFRTPQNPRDICNPKDCSQALKGVDGVIHLASCQPFKNKIEAEYYKVNTEGTFLLRRIAIEKGIFLFIFASSQDVYDLAAMPENGFNENSKTAPSTVYAKSKLEAEEKLTTLDHRGLLIFRLSVLAGDKVHPQSFLSFLVESIRKNNLIEVFGTGKRIYDFVSTQNAAEVMVNILHKPLEGIFNFGAGRPIPVSEIANVAGELTGASIKYLPEKAEKPSCFLDCRKLFDQINVPQTPLKEILKTLFAVERLIACEKIPS